MPKFTVKSAPSSAEADPGKQSPSVCIKDTIHSNDPGLSREQFAAMPCARVPLEMIPSPAVGNAVAALVGQHTAIPVPCGDAAVEQAADMPQLRWQSIDGQSAPLACAGGTRLRPVGRIVQKCDGGPQLSIMESPYVAAELPLVELKDGPDTQSLPSKPPSRFVRLADQGIEPDFGRNVKLPPNLPLVEFTQVL